MLSSAAWHQFAASAGPSPYIPTSWSRHGGQTATAGPSPYIPTSWSRHGGQTATAGPSPYIPTSWSRHGGQTATSVPDRGHLPTCPTSLLEYTCAVVSSLAPIRCFRRTLSLYTYIMVPARRSNCNQCPRSRTLADVPYIFVRGQFCASVRMISNLASKYRSVLDRFENNKSRQVS